MWTYFVAQAETSHLTFDIFDLHTRILQFGLSGTQGSIFAIKQTIYWPESFFGSGARVALREEVVTKDVQ
jgi:hypothetical protein